MISIEELNRPRPAAPGNFKISTQHRRIVDQVCDHIVSNVDDNLSLDALAQKAGYSRSHFSRMFRRIMGVTAQTYITNARMEHAARLLRDTDLPVLSIMNRVNYVSSGSFSRAFRFYTDHAPGEYRERHRAIARERQRAAQEDLQE